MSVHAIVLPSILQGAGNMLVERDAHMKAAARDLDIVSTVILGVELVASRSMVDAWM